MTHSTIIKIENHSGIWYVNHKRLGHEKLSAAEASALNWFIKEYKENQANKLLEARELYSKGEISFNKLNDTFFETASEDEKKLFWKVPVFDRPAIIEGKSKLQRDKEFNDLIQ